MNKLLLISLLSLSLLTAQSYSIKNGSMTLTAKAKTVGIESDFQGKGDGLNGVLNLNEKSFSFTYDLWQIDTGNELRNDHMHENHLETEDYPTAMFSGKIIEQSDAKIVAEGIFKLHGEEKKIQIEGKISNGFLTADWVLNLKDFNIEIPRKFIFAKLDENLSMSINCKLIKEEE